MTDILIIFLLVIMLLAALLVAAIAVNRRKTHGEDSSDPYVDEDGLHAYYDRSLIEKRKYRRLHPDDTGVRTFGKLFGLKKRRHDR